MLWPKDHLIFFRTNNKPHVLCRRLLSFSWLRVSQTNKYHMPWWCYVRGTALRDTVWPQSRYMELHSWQRLWRTGYEPLLHKQIFNKNLDPRCKTHYLCGFGQARLVLSGSEYKIDRWACLWHCCWRSVYLLFTPWDMAFMKTAWP